MENSPFALLENIQYVQVDHTSRCNLLCTQCSRVHEGKLNPKLKLDELNLQDYKRFFQSNPLPKLEEVFFCGNYGDASVGNNFLEAVEYLRDLQIPVLKLATNGSARSEAWWIELAKILNRKRDTVIFSIDGLGDTNHLYRINSNWEKILKNASAFIGAGGRARWDFIVFSHNEHQIDEAKELAKKMGFSSFALKKTNRPLKFREKDRKLPQNEAHLGDVILKRDFVNEKYGSLDAYFSQTQIDCRYKKERQGIFLDFEAKVWPCCWVAAPFWQFDEIEQKPQIQELVYKYGEKFNSLRDFSLAEILNHPWFKNELVQSWSSNKLKTCSRFCGSEFKYSSENERNRIKTQFSSKHARN